MKGSLTCNPQRGARRERGRTESGTRELRATHAPGPQPSSVRSPAAPGSRRRAAQRLALFSRLCFKYLTNIAPIPAPNPSAWLQARYKGALWGRVRREGAGSGGDGDSPRAPSHPCH